MNFDEFKLTVENIDYPAQRLGIFNLNINNKGKKYNFKSLKITGGNNSDLCGFSLNHYGWLHLPMPTFKKSQFHDCEDVCIDIWRKDFISAEQTDNTINLKMKNWNAIISW